MAATAGASTAATPISRDEPNRLEEPCRAGQPHATTMPAQARPAASTTGSARTASTSRAASTTVAAAATGRPTVASEGSTGALRVDASRRARRAARVSGRSASAEAVTSLGWSSTRGILPLSTGEGWQHLDDRPGRDRVLARARAARDEHGADGQHGREAWALGEQPLHEVVD